MDELKRWLESEISEELFELRAHARSMRDDLSRVIDAVDQGKVFCITDFTGRAATVESHLTVIGRLRDIVGKINGGR